MTRRPRRSRLGGSRGVPVLVPVRASPVPSVVASKFFRAASQNGGTSQNGVQAFVYGGRGERRVHAVRSRLEACAGPLLAAHVCRAARREFDRRHQDEHASAARGCGRRLRAQGSLLGRPRSYLRIRRPQLDAHRPERRRVRLVRRQERRPVATTRRPDPVGPRRTEGASGECPP